MYTVEVDGPAQEQVDELPPGPSRDFKKLLTVLGLTPWNGKPLNEQNPDANVYTFAFGETHQGMAVYLIMEEHREVLVVSVLWLG